MKRRTVAIVVSVVIIFIVALLLMVKINQSPYNYLKKYSGSDNSTAANEFLYQEKIGDKDYAVFYINEKNKASCAIMKKTLFSYQISDISTGILLVNDNQKADFLFSSFNQGQHWIDWGIVRDNKIKQVLVNNKEAHILNVAAYDFRICYLVGDESEKTIPPEHKLIE